jgi:hypothetical protein
MEFKFFKEKFSEAPPASAGGASLKKNIYLSGLIF